jgi:GH15 family glucan-1,4-alpha-glucosidase
MALRIEDYGLIGDTQTAALVGLNGSIDWLCLPRFDSGACFAALLGEPRHGRWLLAPATNVRSARRRYRPSSLVLETEFETDQGAVRIADCMPPRQTNPDLVRVVEGLRGEVSMDLELIVRFDYGDVLPWIQSLDEPVVRLIAGPDAVSFRPGVPVRVEQGAVRAQFTVRAGDRVPFLLTWHPSNVQEPEAIDPITAVEETDAWWREWCGRCEEHGNGMWKEAIDRSFITLKALTFAPTGGIVAAPTTSLPEQIGGVRNWDYRYCWVRDATFVLYALMNGGFTAEAAAWRGWLLRAVAGDPSKLQVMYGAAGERRLPEFELPWLPGYEHSTPVRVGNAAVSQLQLDVYGEVLDTLYLARVTNITADPASWTLECALLDYLESAWRCEDEGIWEVRGPRRHFTHSKVMCWVAFDRAIKTIERFGLKGPIDRWRATRQSIHDEVCEKAFNPARHTFTQYYGSQEVDAALLLIPQVGFLPADDPRVLGTVAAIEQDLIHDGLVLRYRTRTDRRVDGLPAGEGTFLACSFWLADNYTLTGRTDEAQALFERLLSLRNDLGLLAEQYDPIAQRLVGNFPQALSHVSLLNTARNLSPKVGPAEHRGRA